MALGERENGHLRLVACVYKVEIGTHHFRRQIPLAQLVLTLMGFNAFQEAT